MSVYIIYLTTNLINNKIYVGQHYQETSACDDYVGSGSKLKKVIKKYGKEKFIRETLEYCTSDNVNEREIFWIVELSATDPNIGYNISQGGMGTQMRGLTHSEESRQKMSQSRKGKHHSEETKQKMSRAQKGRILSEETKQKLSIANSGENHPMYGKHLSDESKQKLSIANSGENNGMYGMKGKKDPFYGKQHTYKTKQKMSENHTDVSGENNPNNKYHYILSDGRNYWKDLTKKQHNYILHKFLSKQTNIITYQNITIIRMNK